MGFSRKGIDTTAICLLCASIIHEKESPDAWAFIGGRVGWGAGGVDGEQRDGVRCVWVRVGKKKTGAVYVLLGLEQVHCLRRSR